MGAPNTHADVRRTPPDTHPPSTTGRNVSGSASTRVEALAPQVPAVEVDVSAAGGFEGLRPPIDAVYLDGEGVARRGRRPGAADPRSRGGDIAAATRRQTTRVTVARSPSEGVPSTSHRVSSA